MESVLIVPLACCYDDFLGIVSNSKGREVSVRRMVRVGICGRKLVK